MPTCMFRVYSHNTVESRCRSRANRWLRYRQTEWAGIIIPASVNPLIRDRTKPTGSIIVPLLALGPSAEGFLLSRRRILQFPCGLSEVRRDKFQSQSLADQPYLREPRL